MSSALLSQFLGLYILIISAVYMFRFESFMGYAEEFVENTYMRYNVAFVELGLGIALVLTHNIWELSYKGVITVIGWMMFIEAIFHLTATDQQERKLIDTLLKKQYWRAMGFIFIFLGAYLLTQGFAEIPAA